MQTDLIYKQSTPRVPREFNPYIISEDIQMICKCPVCQLEYVIYYLFQYNHTFSLSIPVAFEFPEQLMEYYGDKTNSKMLNAI